MSAARLFNKPHVIWQKVSSDEELPNAAIALHIDNCGVIVLNQEGREIVIDKGTIPELCKLLKKLVE